MGSNAGNIPAHERRTKCARQGSFRSEILLSLYRTR